MSEWQGRNWEALTEERLVRAVEVLGEVMKEHGPKFGPLYESVEQELIAFRRRSQPVATRAEPLLDTPARKTDEAKAA